MTAPAKDDAKIWQTFQESSISVKALLIGIFVNQLGAFLHTFLVLFLTGEGSARCRRASPSASTAPVWWRGW